MGKKYDEKNGQVRKRKNKVSPIKNPKDIENIKKHLRGSNKKSDKMWYALFVVGINIGLRASDLVNLKVDSVYDVKSGKCKSEVDIVEIKTGKDKHFRLNKAAQTAIKEYMAFRLESGDVNPSDYLFVSQKGTQVHEKSVSRFMHNLGKELNIPQNLSSHSLRKTFARTIYLKYLPTDPGIIYTLQEMLNHSNYKTTLRYIDIDEDKIVDIYENLNL